ncbi:MAG: non-hydrolyzing UDP-N-acetylglucosamine 2-epimerase [Fimbriimonadaceae bacterium]
MKVVTLFGTRPEIIRLSRVIALLDEFCDQSLVFTGQNYDPNLSDIFFEQLDVRKPDYHMGIQSSSFGEQAGQIIEKADRFFEVTQPDKLLILGDTNSGLAAIPAARRGIPVYHMEAGNRSYDDRIPEELNRRLIDHASTVLMPYTQRSKENLIREGIERQRIFVTGNPILEVLEHFEPKIAASNILSELGVYPKQFFLVTLHRAENVDVPERLREYVSAFEQLAADYGWPVIISTHPRTRVRMEQQGIQVSNPLVQFLEPFGLLDFIKLEKNAACVLTDSGTVQEEACIFRVPNVTIRDVTERAETTEVGSNVLSGADREQIVRLVRLVLASPPEWDPPEDYTKRNVADTVVRIMLSHLHQ